MHSDRLPSPRTPRRGYILLLTLVLLALISASLVGLARASLSTSLAATQAQSELQRRWTALSLQTALLPEAETILARHEAQTKSPQPRFTTALTLNNTEITLTFADESAALPAGALLAELGRAQADTVIRTLLRSQGSPAELRLQPTAGRPPQLLSPEQLFPQATPEQLQPLLHGVSPFSPGPLNIRRTTRPILLARLGTLLSTSQITTLQKQLAENPKLKLADALSALTLSDKTREAVDTRLAETPAAHSLWITTRTSLRSHHRLAIRPQPKDEDPEDPPPQVFEW